MTAFALAASISPGPVNIVALASGMRYGLRKSQSHVLGASLGFVLLLLIVGYCLEESVREFPLMLLIVKWAGVGFLLYMAYGLAVDHGALAGEEEARPPSLLQAASMQWLNPKAWLASMAGVGAFALDGVPFALPIFALVYGLVCYVSIAVWAAAGARMGTWVQSPGALKVLNRVLATLLVTSAFYLMFENLRG
ncbi:LysE family translocator [Agrobacterium vitis]|uniref:LysE family translocator n=2 Tax=Agrobacterium vitis TaxID=373 RepID=A0ABD6GD47_AGRVI|nr:LysE family translocator [Agrobacterium vitis]MUO79332.1 LysE family translocator [Agrobacterium vitis]MUO96157.1 LysE family translocator [Agrobacterium vitis]MUP05778.1 LysE family translocator [Agrobacterium vitis]MUZ82862.1 LysE family translocator [Agrobacterium vitis]MVA11762.1 LysE family translocator [Agrobacterium vitis]